jgi:hypothetical protein
MSDDQLKTITDAIARLDERFGKTEDTLQNEIGGLRDEMHLGFEQISNAHEELRATVTELADEVRTGYDKIAARLDDDDTERAAITVQLDRNEGWIHQLGEKTGTDLIVEA